MTPSGSRPANNCNDPQYTNYKALFPMPVVEGADASALPTPASKHAVLEDGASHGDFGSGATAGAGYARRRIRGVGAAPSSPSSPPPLAHLKKPSPVAAAAATMKGKGIATNLRPLHHAAALLLPSIYLL